MGLVVREYNNYMRKQFLIAILFFTLKGIAQEHPFYSYNDPKIQEALNQIDPKEYQNAFFKGIRHKIVGDAEKAIESLQKMIQ